MITKEALTINGKKFVKYTSDSGYYIQRSETNEKFAEAVDPASVIDRTYVETEDVISEAPKENICTGPRFLMN